MYYINENIKDLYRVKCHEERGAVLRLDMNENPEGLPGKFFDTVAAKITPEYLAKYPEKDRLMELLAEHNGLAHENITVTAGSDEAMRLIFQCFGEAGKKLLTVTPTFEMYDVYSKMFGMRHETVEYREDFTVDPQDILKSIDEVTGIVILLNPNSPIGSVYDEKAVRTIIEKAASVGAVVVVDEAYHYFYRPTYMPLINEYDNLLVLRTFSKLLSMAGLRIGYAAGEKRLIEYIEKAESTFNVNTVAVLFAEEAIQNKELIEELARVEREGRLWLTEQLQNAGYRTLSLEGNYVLFYPKRDSGDLVAQLKKKNIWVRDYGRGVLKGWIRVSTGAKVCMERFWETLREMDIV